jgi:hypothetical protein
VPASKELMWEIYAAGRELLEDLALRQDRHLENVHTYLSEVMEKAEKSSDPRVQSLLREFPHVEIKKRQTALEAIAELVGVDWQMFFSF